MFFVLSRATDEEKNLIPHEESNLRPSDSALRCSTTEPQRLNGVQELLRSSYLTARVSHVDSVMFVNRLRKMVFYLRSSYDTRPAYRQDQQCR